MNEAEVIGQLREVRQHFRNHFAGLASRTEFPERLRQGSIGALKRDELLAPWQWLAMTFDEFRLVIYPLTLGEGKKLFENSAIPAAFTLTESQVTSKGVIIANYKRAGEVITGNVG